MRRWSGYVIAVLFCCVVAWGALPQSSFGLVITDDDSTSEESIYRNAPSDDPGWDNIGQMSLGSGVYLGDGWVLTAYHVYQYDHQTGHDGYSHIDLDKRYDEILGTARRIDSLGTDADMMMFRINGDPDVDFIEIRESALIGNKMATIVAAGKIREGDLQSWNIEGDTYSGFATSTTRLKQWGSNYVRDLSTSVITPGDFGETEALWSTFDDSPYRAEETQSVQADSGGAAFVKDGDWQLTGLVLLVGPNYPYPNDEGVSPGTHAIYDSGAYYADLTAYYDQIAAIRDIRLPGDADRNGGVDLDDFAILRSTFGASGSEIAEHFNADFDENEVVDSVDLGILMDHFGMTSGGYNHPDALGGGAPMMPVAVPEPVTIFVLIGGVPLLLSSPRRRKKA